MELAQTLMERQHGVVSRRQLLAGGVAERAIESRVSRGQFKPVFTGNYCLRGARLIRLGLWVAALFKAGPGSVIGATTAAVAWGFMDERNSVDVLNTSAVKDCRARMAVHGERECAWLHARRVKLIRPDEVVRLNGFPVTTVEATLGRLASELNESDFRDVFSEADRLGKINDRRLAVVVTRLKGRKGSPLLEELSADRLPNVQRTRSRLEVMLLELIHAAGLPEPQINVWVEGRLMDFVWRDARLVVETDGYQYHRGREKFEKDAGTGNLLRSRGWTLLRFTYRMVSGEPEQVIGMIRDALVRGRIGSR